MSEFLDPNAEILNDPQPVELDLGPVKIAFDYLQTNPFNMDGAAFHTPRTREEVIALAHNIPVEVVCEQGHDGALEARCKLANRIKNDLAWEMLKAAWWTRSAESVGMSIENNLAGEVPKDTLLVIDGCGRRYEIQSFRDDPLESAQILRLGDYIEGLIRRMGADLHNYAQRWIIRSARDLRGTVLDTKSSTILLPEGILTDQFFDEQFHQLLGVIEITILDQIESEGKELTEIHGDFDIVDAIQADKRDTQVTLEHDYSQPVGLFVPKGIHV